MGRSPRHTWPFCDRVSRLVLDRMEPEGNVRERRVAESLHLGRGIGQDSNLGVVRVKRPSTCVTQAQHNQPRNLSRADVVEFETLVHLLDRLQPELRRRFPNLEHFLEVIPQTGCRRPMV